MSNPIKSAISSPVTKGRGITPTKSAPWTWPINGSGNVLNNAATEASATARVPDQTYVRATEPYGTKVPGKLLDRTTGWSQVANVSNNFSLEKVQAALRSAENGDTRMYFAYLRDFILGNAMVVSEFGKRKLSTISQPYNILPVDKKDKDDVVAAEAIKQLLDDYPDFQTALVHAMNAVIYPVAVLEKTFEAVNRADFGKNEHNLVWKIKKLHPVSYDIITYRLPYNPQLSSYTYNFNWNGINTKPEPILDENDKPLDITYDVDSWEPDLRFLQILPNGTPLNTPVTLIAPDPDRDIIHRANLLTGVARENFGALGKSLLFLSIMSQLGLSIFLSCMQKYGMPMMVAKVDTTNTDTVAKIMEAFGNANVLNAIAINKDAVLELQEINYSGAADGHARFLEFINDQISKLISGQTLSSSAQSTGLGSGVANLHSSVREDIIQFDQQCLSNMLRHQLFKQLLEINNLPGRPPFITWGGKGEQDALTLSSTLNNLKSAGFEPTDDAVELLSEKFGITLQRLATTTESGSFNKKNEETGAGEVNDKEDTVEEEAGS